ncbi:MAG: hypothetical protein FWC56_05525, partial [Phycisphaerae bacterium]|nr:hypothetical protein [Phycisphaerae bacterium]
MEPLACAIIAPVMNSMKTMNTLRERISEELLPRVKQPGQYIGGEWNQLVSAGDWQRADVKVAIGFP